MTGIADKPATRAADADVAAMQPRVDRLARRHLGATGPCSPLQTLTAGANKGTYAFDAPTATGPAAFILQRAAPAGPPDPDAAQDDWIPHLDGTQEFQVMKQARAAGVPVPEGRHILEPEDGLGDGAVTGRIDGETLGVRILRGDAFAPARARMAAQCGEILAATHRMPAAELPFLRDFDADAMLAMFRRVLDTLDHPIPTMELALRWAAEHRPQHRQRALVHGDFRTGNFIVGPQGIVAVLDWEIAHLGQPLEDLGYLCMRTWRFGGPGPVGGFGRRADLYAAYERASGLAVDPREVRFWEVIGSMRWAFGCVRRTLALRHQPQRALEFAGVGRRLEEPLYDMLNVIEGRDE